MVGLRFLEKLTAKSFSIKFSIVSTSQIFIGSVAMQLLLLGNYQG
jgi:hypothetical protein